MGLLMRLLQCFTFLAVALSMPNAPSGRTSIVTEVPEPAASASELPPILKNPYDANTPDKLLGAQSWLANAPWGTYSGRAFCHDLCQIPNACGGLTNSSRVIESPISVTLAGEDNNVLGGSCNFNWQATASTDPCRKPHRDVIVLPRLSRHPTVALPGSTIALSSL